MTIAGYVVSWWMQFLLVVLVICGLGLVGILARLAAHDAWDWWRDRRSPNPDYDGDGWDYSDDGPGPDDDERCGLCAGCIGFEHCDGRELGCDCTCAWPENWAEQGEDERRPRGRLLRAWDWLVRDRVAGLLEDDDELTGLPPGMGLPPERSWEQMTGHQLPVDLATHYPDGRRWGFTYSAGTGREAKPLPGEPQYLAAARERRVPRWEYEHRAHYAAMGFDYPSGLMARVRALTP